MAIVQTLSNKMILNLFLPYFGSGTFKCALYTNSASLDETTSSYTTAGEVVGTGYTAGGADLVIASGYPQIVSGVAYMHFDDPFWVNAAFTTRGALIYNSMTGDVVVVLDFSRNFTVSGELFRIRFGTLVADALLRATRGQ